MGDINMEGRLKFILNGEIVTIDGCDKNITILQYLRDIKSMMGTKEGCAEGDCGACTLVIGEIVNGEMRYMAVNSCIQFLPMLHGKWLITIENLKNFSNQPLHIAQQSMVDNHASQCGFCTSGITMSIFSMFIDRKSSNVNIDKINDALAGNLCRCTGYGAIISAVNDMFENNDQGQFNQDQFNIAEAKAITMLEGIKSDDENNGMPFEIAIGDNIFHSPRTIKQLADLYLKKPQATILAGGSDLGLMVTKSHMDLGDIFHIGNIAELRLITINDDIIEIGAAVSHSDAISCLSDEYADMGQLIRRFASQQIRNQSTIGGNIANGSPIGDMPPALMAVGAKIQLRKGSEHRQIALEDFYISYGKQDIAAGEFIEKIIIPRVKPENKGNHFYRNYKISKRFDVDISALCAAVNMVIIDDIIIDAKIAFGGMAATVKRAKNTEKSLIGKKWHQDNIEIAMMAMEDDFLPISDMRASGEYRMTVAKNLLYKLYLEINNSRNDVQIKTRVAANGQ